MKRVHPQKQIDSPSKIPEQTKTKDHKCDTCGESFRSSSAFIWHLIYPEGKRLFSCDICRKTFKYKFHLNRHMKKVHPQEQTETFFNKSTVRGQEVPTDYFQTPSTSAQERESIESEQVASEEFSTIRESEFLEHFNIDLDIKKVKTSSQLKIYSEMEIDKSNFECQFCRQQFSDEISLWEHEIWFHQSN
ncbi:zinc finger protein 492-like [Centruroides vittatus]|uniref:zinc finger protein 492-like n=1 Tax=Centruroides vittatus TaxID=120091 RepID=UPI00350EA57C